ncbi:MAG: peptide deformylase [Candidatus Omnitrophota bacterium]
MDVTALKIRLLGDTVLRKKASPVKEITQGHRDILSQMARLMYSSSGIGLAAPQVGISDSMIVVDAGSGLYKLINPVIVKKEGCQVLEEGCLSLPGVCVKVKRARKIKVSACDEFAKPITIEASDLLACVFQHEIDHLKGKLILDYASLLKKLKITKQIEKLKKKIENIKDNGRGGLRRGGRNEGLSEPGTKSYKL